MTFTQLSSLGLTKALGLELLGERFSLRGKTHTGIIDDITATEMFAAGGTIMSQPISVTFKTKTFSPALGLGERVTARGQHYTVRQITTDEISITLVCDLPDKR